MPGPAPQPSAIKKQRGNPGKRPLNLNEPAPQVGLPMCPDYLPDEAKALWDTLGSALVRNGVMTELDGASFADLVETELLNRQLTQELLNTQPVLEMTSEKGESVGEKKNPLWALKLDYLRERRAQHQQFGMTPSSRSKITAITGQDDDPIESAIN